MVRYSSHQLAPLVEELGGKQPEILPGYRIKIIDGNNLAATEHRLSVLRNTAKAESYQWSIETNDYGQQVLVLETADGKGRGHYGRPQ
ncbi:hypothetical protein [Nostoc sp.]|uniref:hypothetical protein n=1 Tax=Nostoc sp. TaxID=1180 RepID=UPI002FF8603C